MFSLFRRIRQKLIDSGSVTRYLLYAVGEILLVVLGILIALQINNWNEQQKQDERERLLLINLRNDFQTRFTELKEINTAREEAIEHILLLNRIIADRTLLPENDEMDRLLSTIINSFGFNEQFNMLDVLFSTGMINDLSDEELKQLLLLWPQQVEEMLEEQRGLNILYNDILRPLYYNYLSMRNINEAFEFRGYNIPKGEPVTLTQDIGGLLDDPMFENYLADAQTYLTVNIIDGRILIDSAERIIELLNQNIDAY
ncbi:DUF6090 family protein [Rhodohalobacter mucosus]|uniref:Uncharacterized protein n=1 Tax=Rhodohalobacter mucosus TaxID=2079485 RepID=A0A316TRX2_9BACT|nr:DUF6090 family protein [Rhodohalobacter mucosus]PWN05765.1 hypothetical protein DDZ15_11240 [Rhodohalobacter mucosus]